MGFPPGFMRSSAGRELIGCRARGVAPGGRPERFSSSIVGGRKPAKLFVVISSEHRPLKYGFKGSAGASIMGKTAREKGGKSPLSGNVGDRVQNSSAA